MKILVADDEPLTNQIVSETLKKWGYDVISTNNGTDAWKVMQGQDPPRLAILDWMMPGLTGIDICQQLRVANASSYTYVILLTGKSDKVDIIEGLTAGADDYLTKPCNPQELRVRLHVGERVLRMERDLLEALENIKRLTAAKASGAPSLQGPAQLTQREIEILHLIHTGKSNDEIAKQFQLSPKWVEAHIHNALLKLNAPDREAAAKIADSAGLLNTGVFS